MSKTIQKEEDKTFYSDDYDEQPPSDVIAYNELRSCADLVRMYNDGILDIQPDFQRDVVWSGPSQTRFIDSLIKQLPIPSMCFSLENKSQKWQVIDGLQRMTTIIKFLTDKKWTLSKLKDIDKKISGTKVSNFHDRSSDLNLLLKRVENLTLPVTVIRCDYEKTSHMEYLFTIFHRLNSGGSKLNNQEIRNCIFSGEFNDLLKKLNKDRTWKKIQKIEKKRNRRYRFEEMVLRFFAFHYSLPKYKGALSNFLNDFMKNKRKISSSQLSEYKELFRRTNKVIWENIFLEKPMKISNSQLEALMFGVSNNIDFVEQQTNKELIERYNLLIQDQYLSTEYLSNGIMKKDKVEARFLLSKRVFSDN